MRWGRGCVSIPTINFPTLAFKLTTSAFNFLTRAFEIVICSCPCNVTWGFELVTREDEFVIRDVELVTRISELVTRILLFHSYFIYCIFCSIPYFIISSLLKAVDVFFPSISECVKLSFVPTFSLFVFVATAITIVVLILLVIMKLSIRNILE